MTAKAKMVSSGVASTGKEVELQEERNKLMVGLVSIFFGFVSAEFLLTSLSPFSGHSSMLDLFASTSFTLHHEVHAQ